jgi:hypothetical protein
MPAQQWPVIEPRRRSNKRNTFVYLVCSPQPRVGKTLTARLLIDYFLSNSRRAVGFDTNPYDAALAAVFPRQTTVVDLASTRGQMALFDSLIEPDETPKIVDVWHVAYDQFLKLAKELEFFEEAWDRGVEPLIVMLTDDKERFVHEMKHVVTHWIGAEVVLTHSEGATKLRRSAPPMGFRLPRHVLRIPELDLVVCRALEEPNVLFDRSIRQPPAHASAAVHARLCNLLGPFFDDVQRLEMTLALEHAGFLG